MKTRAERYDLHPKTVATWKKRPEVHEAPMGPKPPCSTVLTPEQDARGVACRRHPLLSRDDGLSALPTTMPRLTRSSWPRGFQRQGLSRLPEVEGDRPAQQPCKTSPRGSCPIEMAEGPTAEGRRSLVVAMDRARTLAGAERHETATRRGAAHVLRALLAAVPDTIHTVVTDHGTPCPELAHVRRGAAKPQDAPPPEGFSRRQACDDACEPKGLDHRLTKPGHPWTNGPVERMTRTLQEATVTRDSDEHHRS